MALCAQLVYEVCFLLWYSIICASNVSILFSMFPSHLPAFGVVCCDVKSLLREHKEVVRVEVSKLALIDASSKKQQLDRHTNPNTSPHHHLGKTL